MYASLPHFYKAEQLLDGIESGLHPNKKDHGIEMMLEIVSKQIALKFWDGNFYNILFFLTQIVDRHTIVCSQAITICIRSETN